MGSESRRAPSDPSTSNRRPSASTTQNDALNYLRAVKKEFEENSDSYQNFLQIMKDFKSNTISTEEVVRRVKELFRWNHDLILGFNQFLPKEYHIILPEQKSQVDFRQAMSYVTKVKERFAKEKHIYTTFLNILFSYKNVERPTRDVISEVQNLFKNHPDLMQEFYQFLPSGATGFAGFKPESISQAIKEGNNDNLQPEMKKTKTEEREYMQHGSQSTPNKNLTTQDNIDVKEEPVHIFLKKAKERLETEAYEDILKCVFSYSEGAIIAEDLKLLVPNILANHPDLLAEFNLLVYNREKLGSASVKKEEEQEEEDEEEEDPEGRERDLRREKEKERERRSKKSKSPPILSKEKFNLCKPVSELDLSNCRQCTPSYRLLPQSHVMPASTHRSDLEKAVLNDKWVSVTSGSEDYSFKHMRKNQYEESLFRCEDDRFELDMLVETTKSTIERVERLMKKVTRGKLGAHEHIQDFFTPMNMRCIEKLYGDHGLDVMEVIKRSADVALPVVLLRLYQKLEEWDQCKSDFNKVWSDVYAKNYHKSLDHRSFIFKQEDMKNLSSKALQMEIKEKHESNLSDGALLLAIGSRPRKSLPDLEFEIPDSEIQEDIYQIIKFSCKELFQSADERRRALRVFVSFLEPFLGVRNGAHLSETEERGQKKTRILSVGGTAAAVVDESSGTGSPPGNPDLEGEKCDDVEEREEGEISPSSEEGSRRQERENEEEDELEAMEVDEEEGEIEHQEKMSSEGEADMDEITDSPLSDSNLKPLANRHDNNYNNNNSQQVFYGDGPFYVLFRLYQVLYERLLIAKRNSKEAEKKRIASKGSNPGDLYARFKSELYKLLDGSSENGKYEDECRFAIGTQSYLLFTLDKLIFKICKQLQTIEAEDSSMMLLELYAYEKSRGPHQIRDRAYYDNALVLLPEETIYRFSFGSKTGILSIQLIDHVHKNPEMTAVAINPNFGEYLFDDYLSNKPLEKEIEPVFLKRNKRKFGCDDENSPDCKALDGIRVLNGLECKMSCSKSKIAYVLDTEDYLYRDRKKRRNNNNNEDQIAKLCTFRSKKFRTFISRHIGQKE